MTCHICSHSTMPLATALLMGQHRVAYFRCVNCGFVQTETPYWLDEAYSDAIAKRDLGLVGRNIAFSTVSRTLISLFFNAQGKFVDYGGGYGLFVRIMRDAGFDFYRFDKYCVNLFAEGLDLKEHNHDAYELVTAFEVFEHLTQPMNEIARMLKLSNSIFFSTELLPSVTPQPTEWAYYELAHGQHISFYTSRSLAIIADKFGLNLYSNRHSLHLLTTKKIPERVFRLLLHRKAATLINLLHKRESLLGRDVANLADAS